MDTQSLIAGDPTDDFWPAVTIFLISFARTYALPHLLNKLGCQFYQGKIHVVIWNNDIGRAMEVNAIVEEARRNCEIDVIHSSQNYHCMVRFASPILSVGRLILFCDDDVEPGPMYVRCFVDRFLILQKVNDGPLALCACGHRFSGKALSQASGTDVWERRVGLHFFDQNAPECDVHFMHANSLMIARKTLQAIAAYATPPSVFNLVDDYWMSYVLSHVFGARLIKISLGEQMAFIESAYDPTIAMHCRADVKAARITFFDFHRRDGWPRNATE